MNSIHRNSELHMEIAYEISNGSMDKYGKYGRHNQLPEITYNRDRAVFTRLISIQSFSQTPSVKNFMKNRLTV